MKKIAAFALTLATLSTTYSAHHQENVLPKDFDMHEYNYQLFSENHNLLTRVIFNGHAYQNAQAPVFFTNMLKVGICCDKQETWNSIQHVLTQTYTNQPIDPEQVKALPEEWKNNLIQMIQANNQSIVQSLNKLPAPRTDNMSKIQDDRTNSSKLYTLRTLLTGAVGTLGFQKLWNSRSMLPIAWGTAWSTILKNNITSTFQHYSTRFLTSSFNTVLTEHPRATGITVTAMGCGASVLFAHLKARHQRS